MVGMARHGKGPPRRQALPSITSLCGSFPDAMDYRMSFRYMLVLLPLPFHSGGMLQVVHLHLLNKTLVHFDSIIRQKGNYILAADVPSHLIQGGLDRFGFADAVFLLFRHAVLHVLENT